MEQQEQTQQVGECHAGIDKIGQFPDEFTGLYGSEKDHDKIKNLIESPCLVLEGGYFRILFLCTFVDTL